MMLLAQMSWLQSFLTLGLIGVCCLLILVVLVQRGRGEGLTGAFGGGGGSSAFGAKTGDVFTWITVGVAALFLMLSVVSNYAFDPSAPSATATSTEPDATSVDFQSVQPDAVPITTQPAGDTSLPTEQSAPADDNATASPFNTPLEGYEDRSTP